MILLQLYGQMGRTSREFEALLYDGSRICCERSFLIKHKAGVTIPNSDMTAGKTVKIYTDGACAGNPGPGGWGAILMWGDARKELSGGEPATTNNRMELLAAIKALEAIKQTVRVEIFSDSEYLIRGMTEWVPKWRRKGWQKKGGIKNLDLWQRLTDLNDRYPISWHWIRGHNGLRWNERADQLANEAIPKSGTNFAGTPADC